PRVVPAVPDGLLGGAGGALDEQGRVAADGGGEVFGQPGLGRAGDAEQQQRPVGGQGGDGDLDDAAGADVLGRDPVAVAEDVGGDRPRRQLQAGRARPVVLLGEQGQFVRVLVFGVRTQNGHRISLNMSARKRSMAATCWTGGAGEKLAASGARPGSRRSPASRTSSPRFHGWVAATLTILRRTAEASGSRQQGATPPSTMINWLSSSWSRVKSAASSCCSSGPSASSRSAIGSHANIARAHAGSRCS